MLPVPHIGRKRHQAPGSRPKRPADGVGQGNCQSGLTELDLAFPMNVIDIKTAIALPRRS
jgi:hypothetical protein